jgi:succinate dehydrogenase / fumarate reductase, cytochrome b subunit
MQMAGAASPDPRPLSPHLSIWRWHVTMLGSILHRVTGLALYAAALLFCLWLMAVAAGPEAYAPIRQVFASWFGQAGLYALVAVLAYHLANGVRHLVLDTGRGLKPADAEASSWFAILFALAAPAGLWALVTFGR